MEKSDLAVRVSEQTSFSKADAAGEVDTVLTAISDALARGESVSIAGFGSFSAESRPARQGRNPRTGETITIAALKAPSFQTGKTQSVRARIVIHDPTNLWWYPDRPATG